MNKSEHINPRTCRTCGKCCKWFSISYDKKTWLFGTVGQLCETKEENQTLFSELQRYLELETDKIYVVEWEKSFAVVFDFPCKNLQYNNGLYTCKTYTKGRPLLCEKYPSEPKSCEKYTRPINVFRNSDDFLKRVKEITEQEEKKNRR